MLRFERLGRKLIAAGHEICFCPISGIVSPHWNGAVPIVTLDAALNSKWDAVVLPGRAGFDTDDRSLQTLRTFSNSRFGTRLQYILNDPTLKAGFLAVNREFQPHSIVFNNREWQPASFPEFIGDQFHYLIGAVEFENFSGIPFRDGNRGSECWIGGQARKNAKPLIDALRLLPDNFCMRLFGEYPGHLENDYTDLIASSRLQLLGPIPEQQLPKYYEEIDLVVTPEVVGGWSNTAAEAMAAGRPVICTSVGTSEFAVHNETALLVREADPKAIYQAVLGLWNDEPLRRRIAKQGRERIRKFNWSSYAEQFASLTERPASHYYYDPENGLFGKWTLPRRFFALDTLLSDCEGRTILDVGCAEGLISKACLDSGATRVDGIELDPDRVAEARQRTAAYGVKAQFFQADLNTAPLFLKSADFENVYDFVAYLGVHHHLRKDVRLTVLEQLLGKCRERIFIRTSQSIFAEDNLDLFLRERNFHPVSQQVESTDRQLGSIWVYAFSAPCKNITRPEVHNPMVKQFISYPKSGRTWIRFALHRLGVESQISFHHDGFEFNDPSCPEHDFDIARRIAIYRDAGPIIYLERDPCDVIVSLYHQVTGRFKDFFNYSGSISEFIRDKYFGAEVLQRFRSMWKELSALPNVYVVRYEDCHQNLVETIANILAHYGVSASKSEIEAATRESSLDNMRQIEESDSFPHPWLRKRNGHGKVRSGKIGGYNSALNAADIEYLRSVFRDSPATEAGAAQNSNAAVTCQAADIVPVIVLGMHRSGTSAITGTLALLGINAGDHLQEGNQYNPKGYFEDQRIVAAHDSLLSELGSSWNDLRPLPEGWLDSYPASKCVNALRGIVEEAINSRGYWVIKDPRMCRLLPMWLRLFKEYGIRPRFVLPIRHPDASVRSLVERDSLDPDHAFMLWVLHVSEAERLTRGFRRAFLHYEHFLSNWRNEINRVARQLSLKLNWSQMTIDSIEHFVDPSLNHEIKGFGAGTSDAIELAHRCYGKLSMVPEFDPSGIFDEEAPEISRLAYQTRASCVCPSGSVEAKGGNSTVSHLPLQAKESAIDQRNQPIGNPRVEMDRQRYNAAIALMQAEQTSEGAAHLIELAQADTPLWEVYSDLAAIALQQADKAAAEELLKVAVSKADRPTKANLHLAALEASQGQYEPALATLSPYLRADPANPDAHALLREILGLAPALSPIAWARMVADLTAKMPAQ